MSSFLIHLLVPVLLVSAIGVFSARTIWRWSWPAWGGDIDYVTTMVAIAMGDPRLNVHRALFHNVWILFGFLGFGYWKFRAHQQTKQGDIVSFARVAPQWVLMPYFYATHLVLDVFHGGISAFWPLSPKNYFWDFEVLVDTTKPIPKPDVFSDPGTTPTIVEVSKTYLFMDAEEFALMMLYLLAVLVLWRLRRPSSTASAALEGTPAEPGSEN